MAFDTSLEGAEGGRRHKTCFDQDQGREKRAYAWSPTSSNNDIAWQIFALAVHYYSSITMLVMD
jgi:hypothetical protein